MLTVVIVKFTCTFLHTAKSDSAWVRRRCTIYVQRMFVYFVIYLWNGLGGIECTRSLQLTALSLASDERKAKNTLKMAMPQNFQLNAAQNQSEKAISSQNDS